MSVSTTKFSQTETLVITAMMIAVTVILMTTPIGTIRLPLVSITIAHIPAIITAIVIGLGKGLVVALALGLSSLLMAAISPGTILDPFFVNPLVSVLPRILIPITTYFSYHVTKRFLKRLTAGEYLAIVISVVIGNLTNTFGVYTMLYLVYARQIFEKTGNDALGLILTAISTTTVLKCIAVVIIVTPIVLALNKVYNKRNINTTLKNRSESSMVS